MRRGYRELKVWVKAMDLAEACYTLTAGFPAHERYELARQIRRAAVSVPSNIAEGHGRLHRGDFAHHLSIASGSLREVDTQVELAIRFGYATREEVASLLALIDEVGRMIAGLIRAVRRYAA